MREEISREGSPMPPFSLLSQLLAANAQFYPVTPQRRDKRLGTSRAEIVIGYLDETPQTLRRTMEVAQCLEQWGFGGKQQHVIALLFKLAGENKIKCVRGKRPRWASSQWQEN